MAEKEDKKKEEKEKVEAITAIYKVNLHCQQCWREIKKPLSRTQGKINYFKFKCIFCFLNLCLFFIIFFVIIFTLLTNILHLN